MDRTEGLISGRSRTFSFGLKHIPQVGFQMTMDVDEVPRVSKDLRHSII